METIRVSLFLGAEDNAIWCVGFMDHNFVAGENGLGSTPPQKKSVPRKARLENDS
jgi:hypothetical protein